MFDPKALLKLSCRSGAYRRALGGKSPEQQEVLQDLAKFCRFNTTCFHADARIHAALEGRREVFQRIIDYLQLTPEQLAQLYQARFHPEEDEE